jgi:AcrR family transcriptional regulator
MKARERLSSDERRQAILAAVTEAFAENGFNGTTTRALATAAGVSEALIYKHFPSKESLYAAMLDACVKGPVFAEFKRLLALEPSSMTLVMMVHFTVSHYVDGRSADAATTALNCFMARSLLEDGEFARATHRRFARAWIAKFEACLKKAARAGDLRPTPVRPDLRVWFIQHLAFSLMLHLRPKVPVINYRISSAALVEQVTWFALLGVGLKQDAIERYYRPANYRAARGNPAAGKVTRMADGSRPNRGDKAGFAAVANTAVRAQKPRVAAAGQRAAGQEE